MTICLTSSEVLAHPRITVPLSKSITNRALILAHLYNKSLPAHLSESDDSIALRKQLELYQTGTNRFHIEDGGTSLRFLVAFLAVTCKQETVITMGKAIANRPHNDLIDALNTAGFHVTRTDKTIRILPRSEDLADVWPVHASTSSQYATALALIAPAIEKPIQIELVGDIVSLTYLDMTLTQMQQAGFDVNRSETTITCNPHRIKTQVIPVIESDWSSASYFVAWSVVTGHALTIDKHTSHSLQPDQQIIQAALALGADVSFTDNGLSVVPGEPQINFLSRDYTDCPDIAMTEYVMCCILNVDLNASGIEHLKHKESNRWEIIQQLMDDFESGIDEFDTYNDHRMAMCMALCCSVRPICIHNPEVVSKSFPDFWKQFKKLGVDITDGK